MNDHQIPIDAERPAAGAFVIAYCACALSGGIMGLLFGWLIWAH